ncbi:putative phosphopantothenoylcysteine decarboxylase protein [Phaeoacremonium minimum UCRPA7]|uniref:Putative phosphopantothenoylcysteine decarboxylase protein n=1 Tax=Phaeoacremonium minimum (strain UCR-PA7) TaxID=1286976 RepID=R8BVN7_PHAM7|nr:putative phosphopantothenoylcysteine decarboxylase protein [Phaeoacremonium minimum UCRPA7]EOO03417.1 putative phosphopantothenoylcysteine decarboxylase protein [Phaeoacremonium minimum UCRPA7]
MAASSSSTAGEPPPTTSTIPRLPSAVSINEMHRPRKLRLLVAANGLKDVAYAQAVAVRLSKEPQIVTRAIVDDMTHRLAQEIVCHQNKSLRRGCNGESPPSSKELESLQHQAYELVEWADLMVLAPIDADNLAKMMCGITDTLFLEVLRGWDASKRILLVPGMSTHMWENPVTKKQLSKLHRKWHWIRVMPPILWHYETMDVTHPKRIVKWDAFNELVGIIKNQADLLSLGHDVDVAAQPLASRGKKANSTLPPEIWSIIFEYTNDWELAKALDVFTNLEMPTSLGWRLQPRDSNDPLQVFTHELEWTLLSADTTAICKKLSEAPSTFHDLSALAIKLIFKFCLKGVLSYIEANCPHVFKCFDGKTIPTKASAYYGKTEILDWWARSPSFLEKQYDAEALDGASKNGYIHVLEWWRRSGLPLKYTEGSLEQASAKGQLQVLEWWRETSLQDPLVVLKPGRSLLAAAQYGQLEVIQWWADSGVTVGHEEGVCKMASRYGQVGVLELWRTLRGDDKIIFDVTILMEPTTFSQITVLDWWKKYAHAELPGMDGRKAKKVEYKTMDIEEALEDALGDQTAVRRWWAENGLNLGLGTSEWMKSRYL